MHALAKSLIFFALAVSLQCQGQAPAPQQQRDLDVVPDQPAKQSAPQIPRSYALVVGISKYKNLPVKAQLQYPDRDAADMYSTLISEKAGQFPAEGVHELINEHATLANLKQELETWLPSVTGPNDRVFIYFAGHGFISGGKAYLAPYDVDPTKVASTAYPMDELGQAIGNRIHGKWKVLLTDACHSGAITPEDDTAQVNHSLLDLNSSMFSLTASRDREQSFESSQWGGGHGIFTYYVIQGLQGEADTSGDGVVTADELAEYVHTNVRLATHMLQNPTSDRGSFDPNMVLAFNPGSNGSRNCTDANCAGKLRYGTFVIETNMDDVEVWLDGKSLGIFKKGVPQRFPGLTPGPHTLKGAHQGYEPDGPREEQIYPGQDTTVAVRILIAQRRNHAAQEIFDRGLDRYTGALPPTIKWPRMTLSRRWRSTLLTARQRFILGAPTMRFLRKTKLRMLSRRRSRLTQPILKPGLAMPLCCSTPESWMRPSVSLTPCPSRIPPMAWLGTCSRKRFCAKEAMDRRSMQASRRLRSRRQTRRPIYGSVRLCAETANANWPRANTTTTYL